MCERTKPKIKNVFSLICYVIKKNFFLLFTLNILHGYNRRFSLINIKTSMDVCDLCDAKFFYRNFSKKTPCYSCQNLLNQINDMRCACMCVCVRIYMRWNTYSGSCDWSNTWSGLYEHFYTFNIFWRPSGAQRKLQEWISTKQNRLISFEPNTITLKINSFFFFFLFCHKFRLSAQLNEEKWNLFSTQSTKKNKNRMNLSVT